MTALAHSPCGYGVNEINSSMDPLMETFVLLVLCNKVVLTKASTTLSLDLSVSRFHGMIGRAGLISDLNFTTTFANVRGCKC